MSNNQQTIASIQKRLNDAIEVLSGVNYEASEPVEKTPEFAIGYARTTLYLAIWEMERLEGVT